MAACECCEDPLECEEERHLSGKPRRFVPVSGRLMKTAGEPPIAAVNCGGTTSASPRPHEERGAYFYLEVSFHMQESMYQGSRFQGRIWTSDLPAYIGQRVKLAGWLHRYRQLSAVSFLILRDAKGLAQIVIEDREL